MLAHPGGLEAIALRKDELPASSFFVKKGDFFFFFFLSAHPWALIELLIPYT